MAKKPKKRRTRTKHPGVKERSRVWASGRTSYFARWLDPDTNKEVDTNLTKLDLTTAETRREWMIRKSRQIKIRAAEIEVGVKKKTRTLIATVINSYLASIKVRLRERTVETYEAGIGHFKSWATQQGLQFIEELTGPKLAAFREHLISGHLNVPTAGGKRGAKKATIKRRSPHTTNKIFRAVKTFISHCRKLGLTPKLDRDAITDSLSSLKTANPELRYLDTKAIKRLFEAALSHDSVKFKETREEHLSAKIAGSTYRFDAIAPFIAFTLLTGCRSGEALGLQWSALDLMAPNELGQPVGEIRLAASATKTSQARRIDLSVSPGLRQLLTALKDNAKGKSVFGWSKSKVDGARKRLIKDFNAPTFSWQGLRQTTGTFLTNSPGIFGAASAYRSAKQLGHSVAVAEKHYLGLIRGIPRDARTLDSAMGIEEYLKQIAKLGVRDERR